MIYNGVRLTLFLVLAGALAFATVSWIVSKLRLARYKKILEEGIEVSAVVLTIEEFKAGSSAVVSYKVQVKVEPAAGRNYIADVGCILDDVHLSTLKPGSKVIVKYHQNNPRQLILMR